jgi:hypothetical protein
MFDELEKRSHFEAFVPKIRAQTDSFVEKILLGRCHVHLGVDAFQRFVDDLENVDVHRTRTSPLADCSITDRCCSLIAKSRSTPMLTPTHGTRRRFGSSFSINSSYRPPPATLPTAVC